MYGRESEKSDAKENVESESGEAAYKKIFENLPYIALTFDRHGRVLEGNKYTEKLTCNEGNQYS